MSKREYISKYLNEYKSIQEEFLQFIENEENDDDNFQNLNQLFKESKILDTQHDLKLFLHLLLNVANNHHRDQNFFNKIELILQLFKNEIKKYGNQEIFNLFKSNKRILLYLINEKIMTVDEYFVKQIIKPKYLEKKYPQFFAPEIKPFLNKKWFLKLDDKNKWIKEIEKELPDNFVELRNKGENESFICKLIREDEVVDFISYVNANNISHNATINSSIFETNSFLIKKQIQAKITLIEYAAFYGSIQIFNFLKNENAELKQSLWLDVIHSKNAELIHLLEYNNVELLNNNQCLKESIKCHHNAIANYFLDNDENSKDTSIQSLKYYNFSFLQNENINKSSFCNLCNYGYLLFVKVLLTGDDIDVNTRKI